MPCDGTGAITAPAFAGSICCVRTGTGSAPKVATSTVEESLPRRSTVTGPRAVAPLARPSESACAAISAMPDAANAGVPSKRIRAASLAYKAVPSGANAASVSDLSDKRRLTRSRSVSAGPAGSAATTRIAVPPSASARREQTHVSARPKLAPNPRSRSRRATPACGRVSASREISAAAGWPGSNRRSTEPPAIALPKIAAPTALAQRIREPSARHSHAGSVSVARSASCAGSLPSRDRANSDFTIGMHPNPFA